MNQPIDLAKYKLAKQEENSFRRWPSRLGFQPRTGEKLSGLPDEVLLHLAELGPEATLAVYDLVLGVRGWGAGEGFTYLEPAPKMEALDSFLFLADQLRFELMRRLGWLKYPPDPEPSLVELALLRGPQNRLGEDDLPRLTMAYPGYARVADRLHFEPGAVVRSVIPEALTAFREKCRPPGQGPEIG